MVANDALLLLASVGRRVWGLGVDSGLYDLVREGRACSLSHIGSLWRLDFFELSLEDNGTRGGVGIVRYPSTFRDGGRSSGARGLRDMLLNHPFRTNFYL